MVVSKKLRTFAPAFGDNGRLLVEFCSGFSAVGSAHVWGARGRWFESSNPDIKSERIERFPRFFVCLKLVVTPLVFGGCAAMAAMLVSLVVVDHKVIVLAINGDIQDDMLGLHLLDADKALVL